MERGGYALDTGPSVFTAPEILADTLAAVGEKLEERLTLMPLETTYRALFADGSHLDVHADPDAFAADVAELGGPAEADALRRYLADLAELYRLQLTTFIDRNLDSPLDLLGPDADRMSGAYERWVDGFLFSLSGPIYAGTNEIQRNIIADRVLQLPRGL